jgi:PAS domain S-box-containing protein
MFQPFTLSVLTGDKMQKAAPNQFASARRMCEKSAGGSRQPAPHARRGRHCAKNMSDFGRRQGDLSDRGQGGVFGRRQSDIQFDRSPDLLAVVAFDFKLKVLNPAWEKVLGYGRHEMLGRSLSAFVDSEEHIPVHRLLNPNRPAGPNETIEFSVRCKDGTYRCFSWTQRAVPAEQVVFITGKDITDRKKLETTQNLQRHVRKGPR